MKELTDIDFKILDFINKNQPVHIDKINAEFQKISGVEYRIDLLSTQRSSQSGAYYIPNSSYIIQEYARTEESIFSDSLATGIYQITDLGKTALQDYNSNSKKYKRELWFKSAWMPILVTLATNLLIIGIKALLPLILEWFSNIL